MEETTKKKGLMTSPIERPKVINTIILGVDEWHLAEEIKSVGERVVEVVSNLNKDLSSYVGIGLNFIFNTAHEIVSELMSFNTKKKNIIDNEVKVLMEVGLNNSTIQKINSEVLKTWIRIICHSKDKNRL